MQDGGQLSWILFFIRARVTFGLIVLCFIGDEKINNMAAVVLEAIEGFPKKVNGITTGCDSVVCRSRKMWKYVNEKMSDKKYVS